MFRTILKNAAREVADAWKDRAIVSLGGLTQAHHDAVYEALADHIDKLRAERAGPAAVIHVVEVKRADEWTLWSVAKSEEDAIKGAAALFACNRECGARSVEYWRADHTAKKAGV